MMHIRAMLHEDDAKELIALSEMPAAFLETEAIWTLAVDGGGEAGSMARHNVAGRRYMAGGTQAGAPLRLKPVRPSRLDRVLETLSNLPGHGAMLLAGIRSVLSAAGCATTVIPVATNPCAAPGFDTALARIDKNLSGKGK